MTIIKARLNDQALSLSASPVVASGGVGEDVVTFEFDSTWAEYVKKAVFYRDKSNVYHVDVGSDDTAVIPWEVLQYSGFMYFGVFGIKGDETKTSTVVRYRVEPGAITSAAQLDPTPNIYGGISTTAKNLLITILRSGVYTYDQSNNITALDTALGGGTTEPEEPDVPVETTYAISNELINCTSSNSATSAKENAAYSTTLTANDGYTLTGGTVTVMMGGVDITATAYADGVISIAAVTGNVVITASAVVSESGGIAPTALIHSFDFTQGLSDSVGGLTATLGGSATQDSYGVHLTALTDYIGLGGLVTSVNRAYELDMGDMERSGNQHNRLLVQDGTAGFIYRSSGYWTWWSGQGWCESIGLTGFADIANKTIRIEVDASGYHTLYVDGSQIAKSSLPVGNSSGSGSTLEGLVMTLGSSAGNSAAVSTIKAFRVYNMEVAG